MNFLYNTLFYTYIIRSIDSEMKSLGREFKANSKLMECIYE
jgi:hypothetical protein